MQTNTMGLSIDIKDYNLRRRSQIKCKLEVIKYEKNISSFSQLLSIILLIKLAGVQTKWEPSVEDKYEKSLKL